MSVTEPGLQRVPMSWDDYLELPDDVRAEWVDGTAIVSPRPSLVHGAVVARTSALLVAALPHLEVVAEAGLRLSRDSLRGPDVMVTTTLPSSTWLEEPPLLVVEVLSPSTRVEDTVVKSAEYAAAGIGQFWVVDPSHRTLDVHRHVDGRWELLLHLGGAVVRGEVEFDGVVVAVDLASLLPA